MDYSIISLLATFNIIGAAVGYTLGLASFQINRTFMDSVISPILSAYFKKSINNISVTIGGIKFKFGSLLLAIINFIFIFIFIMFLLKFVLFRIVKSVMMRKNETGKKIIDLLQQIVTWRIPMKP